MNLKYLKEYFSYHPACLHFHSTKEINKKMFFLDLREKILLHQAFPPCINISWWERWFCVKNIHLKEKIEKMRCAKEGKINGKQRMENLILILIHFSSFTFKYWFFNNSLFFIKIWISSYRKKFLCWDFCRFL